MTRLWAVLQADHDDIWHLLDAITGGSDAPERDSDKQRKLAQRLVVLQSAHEFAEERVIWPLVRKHCADGDELTNEALSQERQLKRALNELFSLSPNSKEFEECVNTVAAENRSHLTYEQNQAWPRLDDALSDGVLDKVLHQWSLARRAAPTRPHPHIPPHPDVLHAVGPALARRDRFADRLRGLRPPHRPTEATTSRPSSD
jgi:hemerythrin-like domain-containing protein